MNRPTDPLSDQTRPESSLESKPSENRVEQLRAQSAAAPESTVGEFLDFLRSNKKWWLTPIVVILLILSVFVLLTNSAIGPFIYVFFLIP